MAICRVSSTTVLSGRRGGLDEDQLRIKFPEELGADPDPRIERLRSVGPPRADGFDFDVSATDVT
jgi:hypothetical protein